MADVNPPPRIIWPKSITNDPSTRASLIELDRFLLQIWNRTGGGQDIINEAVTNFNVSLSSQVAQLRRRLDGLPEFTVDTTGFTADTTEITADKVIA